ncbi:MAG: phosphate-starvation-inducible PsiE family protein [Myxococcaceae bacterium]|nr:phosphate-starvation-inducible PsiE family protein [Myxococcaceae bacterium]
MSTESNPSPEGGLSLILKKFERFIVVSIVVMMMVVVALSTVELGWIIAKDVITPPILLLDVDELLEILGFVLLILIGVELLETIKAYLRDNVIHVEIVLDVALIALSRKVIVLDLSQYDGVSVLALAALIIALAGASFLRASRCQLRRR